MTHFTIRDVPHVCASNEEESPSYRISCYNFDDNECLMPLPHKPSHFIPEVYVLLHESAITRLHNDIHDCVEALYLVLEYAARTRSESRGYYENLALIFKRLTRIGNLIDPDLMREQHRRGPGKNIHAVRRV